MGLRTGIIKYNLKDRGRTHSGKERRFVIPEVVKLLNSPTVQERVAMTGIYGYYGHWPRVKIGMNPGEGGVVNGKHIKLEPALRTVHIKAYDDGTIEHEVEFLDTNTGKLAQRLHAAKIGAFSSAFDSRQIMGQSFPYDFCGFDYVLEQNYVSNRGYELDGLAEADMALLDEVNDYNSMLDSVNRMLDEYQSGYDMLAEVNAKLIEENVALQSMVLRATGEKREPVLDGIMDVVKVRKHSPYEIADSFHDAALAPLEQMKTDVPKREKDEADNYAARRWGI